MRKITDKNLFAVIIGIFAAALIYLVFGMITSVIQNRFFTRMTPVGWLEHSSLVITSVLLGVYIGIFYYGKITGKDRLCNASTITGGVFGFLTFGCSICNKILVFLLGITGVLIYFDPIRPVLGILSIGLLVFAIFTKAKRLSII